MKGLEVVAVRFRSDASPDHRHATLALPSRLGNKLPVRVVLGADLIIAAVGQTIKCEVKFTPVPNDPPVDTYRMRHPAIRHHLAEERQADTDVRRSFGLLEAAFLGRWAGVAGALAFHGDQPSFSEVT